MACIFYKVPYVFFYEAPAEKTEAFLLVFSTFGFEYMQFYELYIHL